METDFSERSSEHLIKLANSVVTLQAENARLRAEVERLREVEEKVKEYIRAGEQKMIDVETGKRASLSEIVRTYEALKAAVEGE